MTDTPLEPAQRWAGLSTSPTARPPTVIQALAAAGAAVGSVAKGDMNKQQGFAYRGIERIMERAGPALHGAGVVVVPKLLKREVEVVERGKDKALWRHLTLTVRYRFYGPAGDHVDAIVEGEGLDNADKATSKAFTMAYKAALLQVLAIGSGGEDPDEDSPPQRGGAEEEGLGEAGVRQLRNLRDELKAAGAWPAAWEWWKAQQLPPALVHWTPSQLARFLDEVEAQGWLKAPRAPEPQGEPPEPSSAAPEPSSATPEPPLEEVAPALAALVADDLPTPEEAQRLGGTKLQGLARKLGVDPAGTVRAIRDRCSAELERRVAEAERRADERRQAEQGELCACGCGTSSADESGTYADGRWWAVDHEPAARAAAVADELAEPAEEERQPGPGDCQGCGFALGEVDEARGTGFHAECEPFS